MQSAIMKKNDRLFQITSHQMGYFTAKQAFESGYSHRVQFYHKSKGDWKESGRGIFRLTQYPVLPYEELVICSLWSANRGGIPQAVISHDTALSVHELSDIMPGKIHLTVPPSFRKKAHDGFILYKKVLKATDIEEREGFRITTPLATIIDVAESNFPIEQVEQALRDAFRKGILVPATIRQAVMPAKAKERIRVVMENIKKHPVF
jgi:predicted transcriptional regulator of viral defense system